MPRLTSLSQLPSYAMRLLSLVTRVPTRAPFRARRSQNSHSSRRQHHHIANSGHGRRDHIGVAHRAAGLDRRGRAGFSDHLYSKSLIEVCGGKNEENKRGSGSWYVDAASGHAGGPDGSRGSQAAAWHQYDGRAEGSLSEIETRFVGARQDASGAYRFRASFRLSAGATERRVELRSLSELADQHVPRRSKSCRHYGAIIGGACFVGPSRPASRCAPQRTRWIQNRCDLGCGDIVRPLCARSGHRGIAKLAALGALGTTSACSGGSLSACCSIMPIQLRCSCVETGPGTPR